MDYKLNIGKKTEKTHIFIETHQCPMSNLKTLLTLTALHWNVRGVVI